MSTLFLPPSRLCSELIVLLCQLEITRVIIGIICVFANNIFSKRRVSMRARAIRIYLRTSQMCCCSRDDDGKSVCWYIYEYIDTYCKSSVMLILQVYYFGIIGAFVSGYRADLQRCFEVLLRDKGREGRSCYSFQKVHSNTHNLCELVFISHYFIIPPP